MFTVYGENIFLKIEIAIYRQLYNVPNIKQQGEEISYEMVI